jgi:Na+/H+-translocating membrane pyrophosphatase
MKQAHRARSHGPRERPSLLRSERGAILLPALVMGPLLAVACFYETQVWHNIIAREAVQGAGDAVAAGGAAWLAGGMNLLALVNVVMGIVLSVFVAIRAVEILSVAGAVLFTGLAFVPGMQWASGMAVRAGNLAERAYKTEERVAHA